MPERAHETFSPGELNLSFLNSHTVICYLLQLIMFPIFILALNAISQCSLLVDSGGSHFNEIKVMIATFNPLNFDIAL